MRLRRSRQSTAGCARNVTPSEDRIAEMRGQRRLSTARPSPLRPGTKAAARAYAEALQTLHASTTLGPHCSREISIRPRTEPRTAELPRANSIGASEDRTNFCARPHCLPGMSVSSSEDGAEPSARLRRSLAAHIKTTSTCAPAGTSTPRRTGTTWASS